MRKKAFTLIEVLIATVVIVISLLGSLSLFNQGTALVSNIKEDSVVTYALQEQMELIRRTSFDAIITNYPVATNFNTAGFAALISPVGIVTLDYPFANNQIVRVTLRLSWQSANNRTMTKSIATYVTKGGIGG
ncbi:MAG: type II secretion system GspH family protein [Candidatus Omnitrophica bacterium]|nr:type II secretion system GspH family protein [Candidatus Omnitrophota bacterium]